MILILGHWFFGALVITGIPFIFLPPNFRCPYNFSGVCDELNGGIFYLYTSIKNALFIQNN